MKINNLSDNFKIHFVGIGGISMSSLAEFLLSYGFCVSGSDVCENENVVRLRAKNVKITVGHFPENVENVNAVVRTYAVSDSNAEILRANELGIPVFNRAEILKLVSKRYDNCLAVAGSHGKSTTAAMIYEILKRGDFSPSAHIGAEISDAYGGAIIADGNYFITEGCEYQRSFLSLSPTLSVITGIELDHTDYYKSLADLEDAFKEFADNTKGQVITTVNVKKRLNLKNAITVGITSDCDYQGTKLCNVSGGYAFCFEKYGECLGRIQLKVVGLHNLQNALFAATAAEITGADFFAIEDGLSNFYGIKRRQETLLYEKYRIISDYAHHPTQIKETLTAYKPSSKRLIAIFQPHTYSRTKDLMTEFSNCFDLADLTIILPTFPAREKFDEKGSAENLFSHITAFDKTFIGAYPQLEKFLNSVLEDGDTVLFLGAGDIDSFARLYAKSKKR